MTDMKSIRFPAPAADDMVRAILDGRKTVTRRAVKPQPKAKLAYCCMGHGHGKWSYPGKDAYKYWEDESFKLPEDILPDELEKLWTPPCHTDDILYVRETWATWSPTYGTTPEIIYKADGYSQSHKMKWRPSIHMPLEAARIFLRVTDVRVERLQEITEEQAEREGCTAGRIEVTGGPWGVEDDPDEWTARESFADVWDSTIKKADRALYGWDANPWVWVIEFERISRGEALANG